MPFRSTLAVASLLALGLTVAPHDTGARTLGQVAFAPCTLTNPSGASSVDAQCGTFRVPENRDDPSGRQIELAIARVQADGDASPDPVFLLAGGPGQSARESYAIVAPAFSQIRKTRDVILLDQRGTGGSHLLNCSDDGLDEAIEPSPESTTASAQKCLAELADRADVRFYTTTEAVADLDAVRQALGLEQLNLVGVSYGTRVAQQYMKRHPQHVRAVILDGVVPNSMVLGQDHAKNLDASLAAQFERCQQTPACAEAFGDPRANYAALAAQLREKPMQVRYRDATTGEVKDGELSRGLLSALARFYAYHPATTAMLPLLLHEASQGRADAVLALARMNLDSVSGQMAQGMSQAVTCSEDVDEIVPDPADEATVMGTEFSTLMKALCDGWPRGSRPDDFREPVTASIPTLLLSGEFDPVTPPVYGDEVAQYLPQSRHLVLRGQGHNVIGSGCMPKLAAKFFETADVEALEVACLDQLPYVPPFAGYYGWEP